MTSKKRSRRRNNLNSRRARVSWFRAHSDELKNKIKNFFDDNNIFINRHGYFEQKANKESLLKLRKKAYNIGIEFSVSFPK
jgi:hypothetical protein